LAERLSKRWEREVIQQWISYHLRLGRFLLFFTTVRCKDEFKIPQNLTEWAFRKLWEATEAGGDFRGHKANTEAAVADEQRRFGEIIDELSGKPGSARRSDGVCSVWGPGAAR
jgi:hypothetical protein